MNSQANNTERVRIKYAFLEITGLCNFRCVFCPLPEMNRPAGLMDKTLACDLIDEIDTHFEFNDLSLHVFGEPTLHPHVTEIVAHAVNRGLDLNFVTNVAKLSTSVFDQLLDMNCWRIVFSVHTNRVELFNIRGAGRSYSASSYYSHVIELVEHFAARKIHGPTTNTILELHYLDTSRYQPSVSVIDTTGEAMEIIQYWTDLLNNKYTGLVQPAIRPAEDSGFGLLKQTDNEGGFAELFEGLIIRFKGSISFGNVIKNQDIIVVPSNQGYCALPSNQLVILWNGDVVSCCIDYDAENTLGNVILEGGIWNVWTGATATRFRTEMSKGILTSNKCQYCLGSQMQRK